MGAIERDQPSHDLPAQTLWSLLTQTSGVGVALFDDSGRFIYVNAEALRMFRGNAEDRVLGRRLHELHDPDLAAELEALLFRAMHENRPVIVRLIRRGRQLQTTLWPIAEDGAQPRQVMAITRPGIVAPNPAEPPVEVFESQFADFGPLDPLSSRELEVLALLGQGLSIPEVAQVVVRSPRTIERHRDSIARKLKIADRVRLAHLAAEAGLEVRDARLKRRV